MHKLSNDIELLHAQIVHVQSDIMRELTFCNLLTAKFGRVRGRPVRPICPVVIRVDFVLFLESLCKAIWKGYDFLGL